MKLTDCLYQRLAKSRTFKADVPRGS